MSKCCCSPQQHAPFPPQGAGVNRLRYFGIGAAALVL